ncbi:hypothetical protein [Klebsiella pneumoniae]|uniref:hypothetical protein n=1 Tax=Klebsiella pneumoniae TaxID=573 RepID=UPI00065A6D7B|nr:hypothetical protein [Klebsiella pneumoniae]KMI38907.1 hypothetical protein SM87_01153 [Klebsiella pneumoniae]
MLKLFSTLAGTPSNDGVNDFAMMLSVGISYRASPANTKVGKANTIQHSIERICNFRYVIGVVKMITSSVV